MGCDTCPEQGPEPFRCVLWEGPGPSVRAGPTGSLILQLRMELSVDRHTGACLFLQLLNGFIGNLPGAGRGFGWVLAALLGCSELAGAFQCDTEFSMEQQREKLHILL